MCGRYTQTQDLLAVQRRFNIAETRIKDEPRYNIAPTQLAPVLTRGDHGVLSLMRWGLVPSWAKDITIGNRMINARAETLLEKPSFRQPLRQSRCLVVADGFYEWVADPGKKGKIPVRIVKEDRSLFAFAGLWDQWSPPKGGPIDSFTIITTEAQGPLRNIHERMPVIIPRAQEEAWLDPKNRDVIRLCRLLDEPDQEGLVSYFVSPLVNSPKYDEPACIEALLHEPEK